jgi:hypothetical protein
MMTRGKRYRIKTATIALAPDAKGRKFVITIPEGGVVEVVDGPIEGSQSLNVQWEGRTCEMFAQDLCKRGEEVRGASVLS